MHLRLIIVRQYPKHWSYSDLTTLVVLEVMTGLILPLAFDTIMVLLTLKKLWSHLGEMRRLGQKTISQTILHDGVCTYFESCIVISNSLTGLQTPGIIYYM